MTALLRLSIRRAVQSCVRSARYSTTSDSKIELRDYQQKSITSVLEYLARGERRLGLSLATGSGKTVVFSHLIEQVPCPRPEATRTLVLAHRRELVEQAARHCSNVYPGKTIEIEMGAQKASGTAHITVASVASITRRLDKYDPATYKLMIVDEAHHITAASYTAVRDWFGLKDNTGHVALVGVSATFSRADGISLGSAIDHIVFHKDYIEMIEEDYLAQLVITTVQTGVDLEKVNVRAGDFSVGELSKAVNTPTTNELTVRSWLAKAQGRHSTLVFGADVAHLKDLTDCFRRHGVDARYLTGNSKIDARSAALQEFRDRKFPVLLNCGIFTEGTDIPNIDCVLLARPTRSRNLLVQMIGRGLRKHTSKTDCHVIDMVGSLQAGIVTTPTLFGLHPDEVLDNAGKNKIDEMREHQEKTHRRASDNAGSVTFTDYDNVIDFLKDNSGEVGVHTPYFWIEVAQNRFILSDSSGDYLTVQKSVNGEAWHVSHIRRLFASKSPYMAPREVAQAPNRQAAIAAADSYAKANFVHAYINKWARWRRSPASDGQLDFLNKFRKEGEQLDAASVTKGAAAEWITRLKHGARGRFVQEQKRAQRQAAIAEKEAVNARVGLQGPVL